MLEKNVAIPLCVSLILFIAGIGLAASSRIYIPITSAPMEMASPGNTADSWEISEHFQAGETLALHIAAGHDWGSVFATRNGTFPVQLNVTFQASSGGEADFSCWISCETGVVETGTPFLSPINASVIENNASESLDPVSNALGEASCLVKTDVTVTASLDKTSVYDNFGSVESSPQLEFLIFYKGSESFGPEYPYSWCAAPGIFLIIVAISVFMSALAMQCLKKQSQLRLAN